MITFATCNRKSALEFLQKIFPELADTPDSVGPLLDLVEADIVRVLDPMMHGEQISLVSGKKHDGSSDTYLRVEKALRPLIELQARSE